MGQEPIDLVIFDCDGVLVDSEMLSTAVLVEQLALLGISIDQAHALRHFVGHPFSAVGAQISAIAGRDLPADFAAIYQEALLARFERHLTAMPGITDVLSALAVPFCAATSSAPARAERSLAITGLAGHFGDRVFTTSLVARAKPAPDLFLLAAARMGVAPRSCLVIEDSPLGIAAARAAGMRAWLFGGGSHFGATPWPADAPAPDYSFAAMARFFEPVPQLRAVDTRLAFSAEGCSD